MALLAVAAPLLGPAETKAGGFSTPDFGTRRCGMMAVTARPDDTTAIFHNPAGLTLFSGSEVFLTANVAFLDLGYRFYDSEGTLRPDYEVKPDLAFGANPFIGVSSDLGTEDFRFGYAIYAPNMFGAFLPENEANRYHIVEGFFIALHNTFAAAWKVSDSFSIGAGVSLVYLRMQGTQYMNPAVLSNPDLRFSIDDNLRKGDLQMNLVGQDWTVDFNVGLLFRPIEDLYLGMSFFSGAPVELEGDLSVKTSDGTETKVGQHTTMAIPFTLRAGINWEFAEDFEFGFDIYYWHYQVFQEQLTSLKEPIIGMNEMRGPKNYGNSWNFSLGLMHHLTPQWDVMLGYQEDYTPIPEETQTLDNVTRTHHGVSGGVRFRPDDNWRFGLTLQRTWYNILDIQTSILNPPTNGKGHGAIFHVDFEIGFRF